ncbi:MAG: hypothetical protein KDE47_07965 [Caldilineaceae bacterium]|nr:hypothetical protein [Caldilineaceae bacterium]
MQFLGEFGPIRFALALNFYAAPFGMHYFGRHLTTLFRQPRDDKEGIVATRELFVERFTYTGGCD